MSGFSGQVTQSSDDAQQAQSGTVSTTITTSLIGLGSTPTTKANYWGCRFQNVTIPAGATISGSQLSVDATSAAGTMDATVYAQKVANPSTFTTTGSSISGYASTTNTTTWNSALTASAYNASPDISAIITELIGQSGWVSGNAMMFILHALSSSVSGTIFNYDSGSTEAAEIGVTYTTSTPGPMPFDDYRSGGGVHPARVDGWQMLN